MPLDEYILQIKGETFAIDGGISTIPSAVQTWLGANWDTQLVVSRPRVAGTTIFQSPKLFSSKQKSNQINRKGERAIEKINDFKSHFVRHKRGEVKIIPVNRD